MLDDELESDDFEETDDGDNYLIDLTGDDINDEDDDNEDDEEDEEEEISRTYKLDLDAGRIIGFVDDIDAVEQAIRKAIATPRFDCLIYDDQYGSETACADMAVGATEEYRRSAIEDLSGMRFHKIPGYWKLGTLRLSLWMMKRMYHFPFLLSLVKSSWIRR